MKNLDEAMKLMTVLALASTPSFAQTATERAKSAVHAVKREVKKTAHRVEEELCTETKARCTVKKAKHRAEEATDAVVDKANKVKDAVDL